MMSSFMILVSYKNIKTHVIMMSLSYQFLVNRHVTEVIPFGIPPVPRRRSGHCIINNEVIFCGGTRY